MGVSEMLRGLTAGRRLVLVSVVAVLGLAAPAVGLAGGGSRSAHPGALRTVPVMHIASGRVLSRRARLFVPASAKSLASLARPGASGVGVGASGSGSEIPRLQTTTSDTFAAGHGQLSTRIYPFAVNYRDRAGRLAAIDNRLIASTKGGYRNAANSFAVGLPGSLQSAPVRFSVAGAWVSFALQGAHGQGRVSSNRERFAHALPGVAASYTVGNLGLEQALTLHGPGVPASFRYLIRASAGLAPRSLPGGMTGLVDSSGRVRFAIAPARMFAAGSPAQQRTVTSRLVAVAGGWRLTLTPDRRFVARVLGAGGSVVVDPTVFPGTVIYLTKSSGSFGDCSLAAMTPTTSLCGATVDHVDNNGSDIDHTLMQFDVADNVPRNSEVLGAEVRGTIASDLASSAQTVGLYQVTRSWTQSATWNAYDGTHAWGTPGGDAASSPADTASIAPSDTAAYWHPAALVQGWVDGTIPNNGFMLKAVGSGVVSGIGFDSSFSSTPPYLSIRWEPRLGDYRGYTLDSQTLTDRSSAGVNVANGNLLIANQDLRVAGTAGDDLVVGRYYNNLDSIQGAFGRGWTMSPGTDTQLDISGNGVNVYYRGASGYVKSFTDTGSTWTAPPGLDAVLTQNTATTWSLHFNNTGITQHFTGPGGYNTAALLTSVVDRNGNTISYAYNGSQQLQTITDTQGRHTSFQYNAAGYVSQMTDSASRVYKYYQDASGNLTSYIDPAGHTTVYGYDSYGDLTQITTPAGNITKFAYANPSAGDYRVASVTRLVHPTDSTGPTRSYAYYTGGSPCSASDEGRTVETNERGYASTYCYGASDSVTKTVDPDGHVQTSSYTADGNVSQATNPMGGTTVLGYSNSGTTSERLTSIQQGGSSGPKTSLVYNDPNNQYSPSQVTDPQGRSVAYAYDSPGNAHTITDQLTAQNQVTIDHNPDGTISDSIDANANQTTYHYTSGNLTEIDPPDQTHLGKTTISYDALSRPIKVIDGKGQEQDYGYDNLDRVTSVTYKNSSGATVATITYSYDNDGNVITRTDSAGTSTYGYDGLDRITSESFPDGSTHTYTYDPAGNLATLTDAGGTVTYAYNKENLPTSIQDPNGTSTLGYDANGDRTSITYPNGASIAYSYDTANTGRLTKITDTYIPAGGGTATKTYSYSYTDPAGHDTALRQAMTDQAGNTTTYSYDALNRLTEALTKNAGSTVSDYRYTLDGNGNLRQETSPNGTTSYAYNADNQACWNYTGASTNSCSSPPAGAHLDTYDLNGNQTSDGNGLTLAYNPLDQTSAINGAANTYYGQGQTERVSAGGASFQNDILGLSRHTNNGDTDYLTRDPSGQLVDQRGPSNYYPLTDGQGTIIALTDASGHLINSYTYDPNGNRTTSTGSAPNYLGFQGGYLTAGNLYHFAARYYNPASTAWTQQDPLNQISDLTQNDRYLYAGDNPINYSDVKGTSFLSGLVCSIGSGIVGGTVGVATAPFLTPFGSAFFGGAAAAGFEQGCNSGS